VGQWYKPSGLGELPFPNSYVESSAQRRCGPVGVRVEVSHRNDPRDGMPPLEDGLRAGAVQLENRRLQGHLVVAFQYPLGL